MPIAPVNAEGAFVHYEDSGAPAGSSDYVTLVIIHGFVFHGAGFLCLFPHAASHNLRIVALNLRDYPGSTPYTPSEIELLCSDDVEEQAAAVRSQGHEIAAFLKHIVESGSLPPVGDVDGKKTGGIAVMSWSLGNIWAMSLFAHAASLDHPTKTLLFPMIHTWIIYDPPHCPAGVALPDEIYHPVRDENIPLDKRTFAFMRWVSAFWTPIPELIDDAQVLGARVNVYDEAGDKEYRPITDILSDHEVAAITYPDVLLHSGRTLFTTKDQVWWENAQRALCDIDGTLSHVKALLIWCDMSPGVFPFGAKSIVDRVEEASAQGKATRQLTVLKMERANHFIHWHDPERLLKTLMKNVQRVAHARAVLYPKLLCDFRWF